MITHRASRLASVDVKPSRIGWSSAPRLSGLEMVSRATPAAGSSTSRRPPGASSLEDNERVSLGDRLTLLDENLLDHAGVLGLDGHLHLHRLEDDHRVALGHAVADLDLDLPHGSGDVRLDLGQCWSASCARGTRRRIRAGPGV